MSKVPAGETISGVPELVQTDAPVADKRQRERKRLAPLDLEHENPARLGMNLEERCMNQPTTSVSNTPPESATK